MKVKEIMQQTILKIEIIIISETTSVRQIGFSSSGFSFILKQVAGKQQHMKFTKIAFYINI